MTTVVLGTTRPSWQRRRAELVEDVEWCLATGETAIVAIASRCGVSPCGLYRRLYRCGRADLVRRMTGCRAAARGKAA